MGSREVDMAEGRPYKTTPLIKTASRRVSALTRFRGADDPSVDDAKRDLRFAKFLDIAEKAVADWPPFTEEQLADLHDAIYGAGGGHGSA